MDAVRSETPAAYGLCRTLPRISARLLRAAAAGGFFMRGGRHTTSATFGLSHGQRLL